MKLRTKYLPTAVHIGAMLVLAVVITWGSTEWNTSEGFDSMLECGKWALRMLVLCLSITPLVTYFGWTAIGQLRKPLGLWAFGFALMHMLLYLREDLSLVRWQPPVQPFLLLGTLAMLVLTALALTSNKIAMRRLGRAWKRLHRFVYLAGASTAAHALLAAMTSKKMLVRDPQAVYELQLAAALLAVLLVVRIPAVRRMLLPSGTLRRQRRFQSATVPPPKPEYVPALPSAPAALPPPVILHPLELLEADYVDEQLEEILSVS